MNFSGRCSKKVMFLLMLNLYPHLSILVLRVPSNTQVNIDILNTNIGYLVKCKRNFLLDLACDASEILPGLDSSFHTLLVAMAGKPLVSFLGLGG